VVLLRQVFVGRKFPGVDKPLLFTEWGGPDRSSTPPHAPETAEVTQADWDAAQI
jgi:hypothetical protein